MMNTRPDERKMLEDIVKKPRFSCWHHTGKNFLYHYRSYDSFWSILESDSFWLTECKFSNDSAEQEFGLEILKKYLKKNAKDEYDSYKLDKLNENHFILCLSAEGDLLSQWRGYAPFGGVSFGLDIRMPQAYTIFPRPSEPKKRFRGQEKRSEAIYNMPFEVEYVRKFEEDEGKGKGILDGEFKKILRSSEKSAWDKLLFQMIPFIKDEGFKEEKEWRLAFGNEANNLVEYRMENQRKIPFICATPGHLILEKSRCVIRTQNAALVKNLIRVSTARVINCSNTSRYATDKYCFGCTRREPSKMKGTKDCRFTLDSLGFNISPADQNIYVSQGKNQRAVFNKIHRYISERNRKHGEEIKVWCEGHLPIREIIVGPSEKQTELILALEHYCKYSEQYWLRDVDIKASLIPYRTPIR